MAAPTRGRLFVLLAERAPPRGTTGGEEHSTMSVPVAEPVVTPEPSPPPPPAAPPGPTPGAGDTPTLTQAQLNAIVAEERRKWEDKAKKDAETAAAKAAEAAAAEQGKYAELADTRGKRVAELEPQVETLTGERDRALKVITDQNAELAKDLPEWVTDAIAGKDAVDTFAFLSKHRGSIVGTNGDKRTGPPETKTGKVVDLSQEQLNAALRETEARMRASF